MENNKKIICFDINGTLTDDSSWSMFGDSITKSELNSLLKSYSNKEINIESLWERMVDVFRKTGKASKDFIHNSWIRNLNLKSGAKEVMDYLKDKGYDIYLVSCSVNVYAEAIVEELGLKGFFTGSNFIFDNDDELIKIESQCNSDNHFKRDRIMELAKNEGVDIKDIIFVGDDHNDIEAFKMTGHGIAMASKNQELVENSWKQINSLLEIMKIL